MLKVLDAVRLELKCESCKSKDIFEVSRRHHMPFITSYECNACSKEFLGTKGDDENRVSLLQQIVFKLSAKPIALGIGSVIATNKRAIVKDLLKIYGTVDAIPDWRLKRLGLSRNDLDNFGKGKS